MALRLYHSSRLERRLNSQGTNPAEETPLYLGFILGDLITPCAACRRKPSSNTWQSRRAPHLSLFMLNTADGSRKANDNQPRAHALLLLAAAHHGRCVHAGQQARAPEGAVPVNSARLLRVAVVSSRGPERYASSALGRRSIWFEAETQSLNPDVSCYLKTDGMWACAFDVDLKNKNNVDQEDSW